MPRHPFAGTLRLVLAAGLLSTCTPLAPAVAALPVGSSLEQGSPLTVEADAQIEPYRARFGRQRPIIAIVGENGGTELTDYVIPLGVLQRAGVGNVVALAVDADPMTMRPALRIQPQATIADFDARVPQGADYVVVPAVVRRDDPALISWIRSQASKGATLVSICDGALVLAGGGFLDGRRATAHWATEGYRRKTYPAVRWEKNRRYVADGQVISSAGISAAVPTSIALVEAIDGHDRAAALADELGVTDWSAAHDSDAFQPRLGRNLYAFAATQVLNARLHHPQSVGIPVQEGVDELALALTADAYGRSGRAHAYAVAADEAPLKTRDGLTLLPDAAASRVVDRRVALPAGPSTKALESALDEIAHLYGRPTAYGVALDLEYPGGPG